MVGLLIRRSCSLCCRCICLLCVGVHHGFLHGFGFVWCVVMLCCSAVSMFWKCCDVVVLGFVLCCAVSIAVCRSGRIVCLCLMYLLRERVLLVVGFARGIW